MSESTLPTFSVVTVSYNQGEFIRDTIESVLNQNYPNFEHIIVDAGSTDNTLEILKSYQHLTWTSEPDRGQSHGLNKGFARARGDVVAWLNSDDWYAPGAFHEVARLIQDAPVVIGGCVVTNREGAPTEEVPNVARSWFDILKYWVYYSVPPQPGIFFRRELFSELGIDPASALDEGLEYTMDYDLWMRVTERHPLSVRSPKVFSFMRNYESNKTGAFMASAHREMSRVFRRHSARKYPAEQALSLVLPMASEAVDLRTLARGVAGQSVRQCEILCVDYSGNRGTTRAIRAALRDLEPEFPFLTLRCQRVDGEDVGVWAAAVNRGVRDASAPYIAVLPQIRELPPDFAVEVLRQFARDNLGLLISGATPEDQHALFRSEGRTAIFNPLGALQNTLSPGEFICRKVAWMDCGGLAVHGKCGESLSYCIKRLLLTLVHKAWLVANIDGQVTHNWIVRTISRDVAFRLYENSEIIDELASEIATDSFASLREKHGFALSIPEDLAVVARQILSAIPRDFRSLTACKDEQKLVEALHRYPNVGSLRIDLAEILKRQGRGDEATQHVEAWRALAEYESQIPLYGVKVHDA